MIYPIISDSSFNWYYLWFGHLFVVNTFNVIIIYLLSSIWLLLLFHQQTTFQNIKVSQVVINSLPFAMTDTRITAPKYRYQTQFIILATNNHHPYCKVSIPKCHKVSQQRRSIYNGTIQILYLLSMLFVATSQNELGRCTVWRLGISMNNRISHSSYFLVIHELVYKSCNNSIEVKQVLEDLYIRSNRRAYFALLIHSLHHAIPKVHIRRVLSIAMKEDL